MTINVVDSTAQWLYAELNGDHNREFTVFALNIDSDSIHENGLESVASAIRAGVWVAPDQATKHCVEVRTHSLVGSSIGESSTVWPMLSRILEKVTSALPVNVPVACGWCVIDDCKHISSSTADVRIFATVVDRVLLALAAAMHHSSQNSFYSVDPNTFWASPIVPEK